MGHDWVVAFVCVQDIIVDIVGHSVLQPTGFFKTVLAEASGINTNKVEHVCNTSPKPWGIAQCSTALGIQVSYSVAHHLRDSDFFNDTFARPVQTDLNLVRLCFR